MLKIQNRPETPQKVGWADNISVVKNQTAEKNAENAVTEPSKYLWIRAPKDIVYSSAFSDGAKLLYLILVDYQGRNAYAFPSLETLATDSGKSVRRVQQILKELEEGGAVEIISQPGWVNLYRVCLPPHDATENREAAVDSIANTDSVTTNTSSTTDDVKAVQPTCIPLTESEYEVVELAESDLVAQSSTRLQNISPLPMQNSSTELDPVKLENIVCEKSRRYNRTRNLASKGSQQNKLKTFFSEPNSPEPQIAKPAATYPSELSETQLVIAEMLCKVGVASTDAKRIALTNPTKEAVAQWIEFAKSKNNPGGYLAVVLGKKGEIPPPLLNIATEQSSRKSARKKWQPNKQTLSSSQEAGAIAFMRRHQNELADWQKTSTATNEPAGQLSTNTEKKVELTQKQVDEVELTAGENIAENVVTEFEINPQMRSLIRQLDKQAAQYLKQARIEENKLIISFVGNYCPNKGVSSWLPALQMQYKTISEIVLL